MADYRVYDVFTDTAFGGNQLAVFPNARGIAEDKLQSIARAFNYSEVTFVYPPNDPNHAARVRIFTPTSEIGFAGHPIIGTTLALFDLGYPPIMTLELGVGPIPCVVKDSLASFTTSAPLEIIAEPDAALVARALAVPMAAVKTTTHPPTQASLGLPFVLVELQSRSDLSTCMADLSAIREGAKRYPTGLDFALFAYFRDGGIVHSRMFAPLDNITEDPATGSASATLAALLTQILDAPQRLTFHQGEDMGRPSKIAASTTQSPLRVTLSGRAVHTMSGQFVA